MRNYNSFTGLRLKAFLLADAVAHSEECYVSLSVLLGLRIYSSLTLCPVHKGFEGTTSDAPEPEVPLTSPTSKRARVEVARPVPPPASDKIELPGGRHKWTGTCTVNNRPRGGKTDFSLDEEDEYCRDYIAWARLHDNPSASAMYREISAEVSHDVDCYISTSLITVLVQVALAFAWQCRQQWCVQYVCVHYSEVDNFSSHSQVVGQTSSGTRWT